jgi:DNA-binding transcriptional ArsR family regulator
MIKPMSLDRRTRQSAVVARMMITCFTAIHSSYQPGGKNIARVFPDLWVAMTIRMLHVERGKPVSVRMIARTGGLPRANVRRSIAKLTREKIIRKEGQGYVGDSAYLAQRLEADYFREVLRAIDDAATELRALR